MPEQLSYADYAAQTGGTYFPPGTVPPGIMGGTGGVELDPSNPQGSAPVGTLAGQSMAAMYPGLNLSGNSGGGQPTPISGQTQAIKLSDGTTALVDMTTGAVVNSYGTPNEDFSQKRQLQQEQFSHEESMQAQREASANARQQNDPANDPWRQMMPRYTAPSAIQGLRGALDIIDPNTGELISARQPEPPDVRVQGGNLIVPPGANAQVYYNGNKGQPTNVSGGPLPRNGGARFTSAMDIGNQVSGRLRQPGQQGGSGGAGGMGGGGAAGGRAGGAGGGAGGRGGAGGYGGRPPIASNQFAQPSPVRPDLPRPPWEDSSWQDPYDAPIGRPPIDLSGYDVSESLDPFGPDMDYNFGYYG